MSRADSENQPLKEEELRSETFILANIKLISRCLGIITCAVMWISTVVIIEDHNSSYVGYYLIAASTIVTFFELTWIFDKSACCVREGCCCRIWAAIMWVDCWKKFILYVALAIPLFLENNRLVLGIVSGLLLILLSTLYLIKTFRSHVGVRFQKTETRYTRNSTQASVTHEISTQTDRDGRTVRTYETRRSSPDREVPNTSTPIHYESHTSYTTRTTDTNPFQGEED